MFFPFKEKTIYPVYVSYDIFRVWCDECASQETVSVSNIRNLVFLLFDP